MKPSKNPQVLIIDENQDQTKLLSDILAPDGFTILTAQNGPEALNLIRKYKPALLISGLKIPQMNGLELLKEAKKLQESLEVILVAVTADIDAYVKALVYGAYDYFIKPLNFEVFRFFVSKAIYKTPASRLKKGLFASELEEFTPAPWPSVNAKTKDLFH